MWSWMDYFLEVVWDFQFFLLSTLITDIVREEHDGITKLLFGIALPVTTCSQVIGAQYMSVFLMVVTSSSISTAISQILRGYEAR